MKKILNLIVCLMLGLSILSGCRNASTTDDDDLDPNTGPNGTNFQTVIDSYVDQVVIAIYTNLNGQADNLQSTLESLASSTTPTNLNTSRQAWLATRVPWENSESFLFGPVDFNGYDPALDTWPVDIAGVNTLLGGGIPLTESFIAGLDPSLKGFHVIEYLLWGANGTKTAGQFTSRELDYLIGAAADLASVAHNLMTSWTTGIGGAPAYGTVFKTAGTGNTIYPSQSSALEEMVRGMMTICDEVAAGKIGGPYEQQDPGLVESPFANNSITDFTNNMLGVKQAFDLGIGLYLDTVNPTLAAEVDAEIQASITALSAIPEPFGQTILNPSFSDEIENAQDAILAVFFTLDQQVLPLVIGQ